MPFFQGGGGHGTMVNVPPPKPKPAPPQHANVYVPPSSLYAHPAPPSGIAGAVSHAIGNVGAATQHAVKSATTPHNAPLQRVSQGPSSGAISSFKNSPAYRNAIIQVFRAQSPAQQQAIVRGAQSLKTPEGSLILSHLGDSGIWDVMHGGALSTKAITKTGGLPAAVSLPMALLNPAGDTGTASQLFKNAGSDALNLVPGTIQGGYKLGDALVHAHVGNAFSMLVDPYVHFFEHPYSDALNHPLNSALLFAGAEAAVGRGAGAAARSGALGERAAEAASTARAPLRLGGDVAGAPSPIIEHRSYSPNVITKAAQVAWEKHLTSRGIDPNIAHPGPRLLPSWFKQSANIGVEAKLRRIADEEAAVRQMQGRSNRSEAVNKLNEARPHKTVQNMVSHITQGVVRTPATAKADLLAEIDRLKAAQTGKRTPATFANRRQVRDLSIASQHPEHWQAAFDSAAKIRAFQNSRDAYFTRLGLLDPEQAMRSKLFPYAQAHMGASYDHAAGHLVNADHPHGLPTQAILDHLEKHGVPDPSYVGHFPDKNTFWRYYQAWRGARGSLSGMKRTGEAFRQGNYDHSYDALVAQAARAEEAATKASLHDRIVNRLGIKRPDGQLFTPNEARGYAHAASLDDHGNLIPGAPKLVPMTAAPGHALELVKDLQHPAELQHIEPLETQRLDQAISDADGRHDGTRNVVLVPGEAVDRFKQQFEKTGGKGLGRVTQQFRRTVLPYSTHWMTQIATEAGLRGLIGGVIDPRSLMVGRQLMRRLETTTEGKRALQEMVNATFYNKRSPLMVHNPRENAAVGLLTRAPIAKQIIGAHNKYADTIGAAMYSLEHEFRVMGMGKIARQQVQEFTRSYQGGIKLQGQNLETLARKLETDPALVARFGRQVDDIFGKYNKFSPQVRAAVQTYVPFLPWYLNAAKFVLWHLPAKHPVATALLAALRVTVANDVKNGQQEPLNAFARDALGRLTPFGIFNMPEKPNVGNVAGGALGQLGEIFLPQFQGSMYNLAGVNSFGEGPLKGPGGDVKPRTGQAAASAAENLLEGLVPLTRMARLAREGGRPSYGTSTLVHPEPKPEGRGSATAVLNRIFNPFYSYERAGSYGGGASSGGGSGGGAWTTPSGSGGAWH